MSDQTVQDPFDVRRARGATGLVAAFNEIGVLNAADVHVATRIAALGGESSDEVVLAAALAVRGPRIGHVYVDLATIADTATVDSDEPVDLSVLPWPAPAAWLDAVAASPLVAVGEEDAGADCPLRLSGSHLYLDRYWREERRLAADLTAFGATPPGRVDDVLLADGLSRLFTTGDKQREAGEAAIRGRFAVVAGGPGTGKTTTVARIVALLLEQAGDDAPLVALAAPTGKAAARLEEAVHAEARTLKVDESVTERLLDLNASTLHRLLGWRPGSHSRFRHDRHNRLPHDVVIVDETSMVSLSLMARLVEAVRPEARLVLVGDPGQLASIEAGAVLGDVVSSDSPGIVVLDRVHRFGEGIGAVAEAIRRGDADAVVETLRAAPDGVTWLEQDAVEGGELELVREGAVATARAVTTAARAGQARAAIDALQGFRVLCAHRRGPYGVAGWTARIEGWLAAAIPDFAAEGRWYAGRPLLVTENDYALRLYNGDTGVVVATPEQRVEAAFERGGAVDTFATSRLGAVDTVYAMTVHKSQGSQFATAAVLLPAATSAILTRELLYTAVTRAQDRLILVGTEATIRAAVMRPIARASGLRTRLGSS